MGITSIFSGKKNKTVMVKRDEAINVVCCQNLTASYTRPVFAEKGTGPS